MTHSLFNLHITIKIETNKPIEFISDILDAEPTDFVRMGEAKFDFLDKAEQNIWILTEIHTDLNEIGNHIQDFIKSNSIFCKKINELNKIGKCVLRLSVVSDYAQIGFCLSQEDLQLLSQLNIPFEISIFSWGNCVDE